MRVVNLQGQRWGFTWRRRLFVWEETLLASLLCEMDGFLGSNEEDRWRWKLGEEEVYTVKSMYVKLEGREVEDGVHSEGEKRVFRHIWKDGVPSKVAAFV